MLVYSCDYCETKYTAKAGLHGISYDADGVRHVVENEHAPCHSCADEAERAKLEALERRKKKV